MRRTLAAQLQREHSVKLTERLRTRLDLRRLKCVAGYLADDGEIDLASAFRWFQGNGVSVVVPYLREGKMRFTQIHSGQRFVRGAFGIAEPARIEEAPLSSIDLVLVPLVAFSSKGNRLGRGGGHYDRSLESGDRPVTLGIAHEFQLNDEFCVNPRDVALDAVVTERMWRVFRDEAKLVLVEN